MEAEFSKVLEKEISTSSSEEDGDQVTKVKNRDPNPSKDSGVDGSFKDALLNQSLGRDEDVQITMEANLPVVTFSDKVQNLMAQAMQRYVVMRLLGRGIGFRALYSPIMALWNNLPVAPDSMCWPIRRRLEVTRIA